jgi:hypothetical protein
MFYLGTLELAAGQVEDNSNTNTPFTIPDGCKRIGVQPDIAGMFVALNRQAEQTPAATAMLEMNTAKELIVIELGNLDTQPYIVGRNPTAGAGVIKVFALY